MDFQNKKKIVWTFRDGKVDFVEKVFVGLPEMENLTF